MDAGTRDPPSHEGSGITAELVPRSRRNSQRSNASVFEDVEMAQDEV